MNYLIYRVFWGACLGLISVLPGRAADNMWFHGTLLEAPSCVINDDNMIDVYFGHNVGIYQVNGVNYTKPVNYQLVCAPNISGWSLGLTVIGSPTSFDAAALQTNITDLGIRLTLDGKAFTLNERIPVTSQKQPVIQAVPVKKPGSTLPEGAFEVTATLLAEYQ
ncbi:pilus assembly protein [Photorhabdus sp. HUG-39]|uniref:Fimbrial protein n=1 Tax=Photorhabdus kayaii TaxID=230088 RepID=A0ABX0AYX5_9GAMM|nr:MULTISPECIES: fimbrial protein [Photorhabdus]MCC8374520.1 fimbrial protein [Photorhabdus bodei]MDB6368635.1 fimbrial protein [Photorhabdus bodei]NDL12454.1 fimbrial protein [Photorhabdus kayaii]NDL26048.1 fimbrial protein [Photorhabdus kayaii]RAX09084.1 pilus assembly protein [Photorhabdus sp. HUG-39]